MSRNANIAYFCHDLRFTSSCLPLLRNILNPSTSPLCGLKLCSLPKIEAQRLVPYIYIYIPVYKMHFLLGTTLQIVVGVLNISSYLRTNFPGY
jgi:hypothetical protein